MDRTEATSAALDAIEPTRLLHGEDETTTIHGDAVHWATGYSELLDFKRAVIDLTRRRASAMDPAGRAEVEETDLKVLTTEEARFRRRLGFWTDRAAAMSSPAGVRRARG